ncbi:MAG TPA: hypothetical protein VM677_03060 [Actinokineospora sp.]|nr:hypothetical protein [Actinokineospora sp.]
MRHEPNGFWRTKALIDTGSPITVFDRAAAEALVVNLGRVDAETGCIALLGDHRRVQFEHIDLSLVSEPEIHWTARVAFILDQTFQMAFQGILGTDGFLDKWAVTFNRYYDYFIVQRPDEVDS